MLFFGSPPPGTLADQAVLTVITMAGLRLPDLKIEREYWSAEEQLALPMLHTAHRLAVRRCYGGSMESRKLVGLDEAHFMEGWRSGRSFLIRLARDSRKWNLSALVASQNPRDILGLDVQNLVSTVFVGRIAEDQEIAAEALRLLRVPVDDGYEAVLASLSQTDAQSSSRLGFREFVMRDVDGRVQKIRVDVSWVPGLLDYLDTTPTGAAEPAHDDGGLTCGWACGPLSRPGPARAPLAALAVSLRARGRRHRLPSPARRGRPAAAGPSGQPLLPGRVAGRLQELRGPAARHRRRARPMRRSTATRLARRRPRRLVRHPAQGLNHLRARQCSTPTTATPVTRTRPMTSAACRR